MAERPTSGGLKEVVADQFSFEAAVGGVRGILESVVPTLVFTVVYTISRDLRFSVLGAVGVAALLAVVRLTQRQSLAQALSGLVGVIVAAGIAWYTGSAINFFLLSIIKNLIFTTLCIGSIAVGWPYVGVMLGFLLGEGTSWRQVPARKRVYVHATWVWAAMFGIRLAVQIPLYFQGRVTSLGVASVPLGLPLFGVVILICWLIVRRVPAVRQSRQDEVPVETFGDEVPREDLLGGSISGGGGASRSSMPAED